MPVYCCAKPGCPPGRWCIDENDNKSVCPEDPTYLCLVCGKTCPDLYCLLDCMNPPNPCPNAVDLAIAIMTCIQAEGCYPGPCDNGWSSTCDTCMNANCPDEIAACEADVCLP
jgi:hypothetical protein